jgi:hypothetical protein
MTGVPAFAREQSSAFFFALNMFSIPTLQPPHSLLFERQARVSMHLPPLLLLLF